MRLKKYILIFISFFFISCEDDNETQLLQLGTYEGTYTVIFNYGTSESHTNYSETQLILGEGYYKITENTYITPPYSLGKYELSSTNIIFQDTIIHTAEFDWSLIIHGEYQYEFEGNKLTMSQIETVGYLNEVRKYTYELQKQD